MKKDQFVIACLESPSSANTLLPYARHCAARLGKGIIVINVSKDGQSDWLKQYGLPYVGLKGDWKTVIDGLPTAFGGVLAVTEVNRHAPRTSITHPTTLLKVFGDCKIAYLVVESGERRVESGEQRVESGEWRAESGERRVESGERRVESGEWRVEIGERRAESGERRVENGERSVESLQGAAASLSTLHSPLSTPNSPLSTFLTLDHRRESKEKLVWGSYMVRFFGTQLTVAVPDYSDGGLREKVKNNVLFMKKIYKSLNVDYTLKPFKLPRLTSPDRAVLQFVASGQWSVASSVGANQVPPTTYNPLSTLLISMTTDKRDRDIGDLLFGNPERRLLSAANIPILFLNQRDDLYVLCD